MTVKTILSAAFFCVCFMVMAQNDEKTGTELFEKGVSAFEKGDIRSADSLFELSATAYPNDNVFYNISLTKLKLGDTCKSCYNLFEATKFGRQKYSDMYKMRCMLKSRIWYMHDGDSTQFYSIITKERCNERSTVSFFKFIGIGTPDREVWLKTDSSLSMTDFQSPEFLIEQYVDTSVYNFVEEVPSFPGGEEELMRFLVSNIKYPQKAKEEGIQGSVYVTFVVSSTGEIGNISVIKGVGGGCDEEAIRVIKLMPKWIPGKQNGKTVNVLFTLPIRFFLN